MDLYKDNLRIHNINTTLNNNNNNTQLIQTLHKINTNINQANNLCRLKLGTNLKGSLILQIHNKTFHLKLDKNPHREVANNRINLWLTFRCEEVVNKITWKLTIILQALSINQSKSITWMPLRFFLFEDCYSFGASITIGFCLLLISGLSAITITSYGATFRVGLLFKAWF